MGSLLLGSGKTGREVAVGLEGFAAAGGLGEVAGAGPAIGCDIGPIGGSVWGVG